MLKQRLITAAVLIPIVIWGIIGLPTMALALLLALVVLGAAWEWGRLIHLRTLWARLGYVGLIGLLMLGLAFGLGGENFWSVSVLLIAGVWWLVAMAWVIVYRGRQQPGHYYAWTGAVIGGVVLVPGWLALSFVHGQMDHGPSLMLFFMILVWTADSGAYFVGRKWGRNKLLPFVSPGKTIEGVVGALAAGALVAVLGSWTLGLTLAQGMSFMLICVATVLFSIVGDLLESLFKRRVGVKDSGGLLPGHGGVLDRIDSITAAAPVFALGLMASGLAK